MRHAFLIAGLSFFLVVLGCKEEAPVSAEEEKNASSDQPEILLEQVLRVEDAIRPGDPKSKVTDYLGPAPKMPEGHHGWNYGFSWGKPNDSNTPRAGVKVRFDGDTVGTISLDYRPALKTVTAARSLLPKGSTQEDVKGLFGYPHERLGNQWRYSWLYMSEDINSWELRITFDEEKRVSDVKVDSGHADFELFGRDAVQVLRADVAPRVALLLEIT